MCENESVSQKSQVVVKRITFCGRNCVFLRFSLSRSLFRCIQYFSFLIFLSLMMVVVVVVTVLVVLFPIVLFELLHIVVVSAWRLCDLCRSCRFSSSLKFKVNPYQCKNYSLVIIATRRKICAQTLAWENSINRWVFFFFVLFWKTMLSRWKATRRYDWFSATEMHARLSMPRRRQPAFTLSTYPKINLSASLVSLRGGFIYGMGLRIFFGVDEWMGIERRYVWTLDTVELKKVFKSNISSLLVHFLEFLSNWEMIFFTV